MAQTTTIPETIDNGGTRRLSLLVTPTALEAMVHHGPGEAAALTFSVPLDGTLSPAGALEAAVYATPLLLQPFGKTDIVLRMPRWMLVPAAETYAAGFEDAISDIAGDDDMVPVVTPVDEGYSQVTFVDRQTLAFLRRTFDTATLRGHIGVLARWFGSHRSRGNTGKVYVNLHGEGLDILVFDSMGLAAAKSADTAEDSDAVYYILAMARAAGNDSGNTDIFIGGDADRRAALTPSLGRFATAVMPAIFPSALFGGDHAVLDAPLTLSLLPLCE